VLALELSGLKIEEWSLKFKDSDALPAPTHPSDCFEIWSHKFEWEGSL
jgi:hypothetical protein